MQSIALAALIIGAGALRLHDSDARVPDLGVPTADLKVRKRGGDGLKTEEELMAMGNWCAASKSKSCLTHFEKKYLEEHKEELKEALEVLRKPGCVKTGSKVVTGGYFRTGSTLLFNQVRLWMNLAFPETVSSGFDPNQDQFHAQPAGAVVAKVHGLKTWMAEESDHLVMSRRKVVDSLVTRTHKMFEEGTASEEELQKHVEKQCSMLMKQQSAVYKTWEKTGRSVDYDVLLADYLANPAREIQKIATGSGICKEAAENKALVAFVQAVGENLGHSMNDNLITQMHPPSDEGDKAKVRPAVQKHMDSLPKCSEWAASEADHNKNKDDSRSFWEISAF